MLSMDAMLSIEATPVDRRLLPMVGIISLEVVLLREAIPLRGSHAL